MPRALMFKDLSEQKGIGFSRPTIDDMVKRGEFPKPFPLGKRTKAWLEEDVDEWLRSRADRAAQEKEEAPETPSRADRAAQEEALETL